MTIENEPRDLLGIEDLPDALFDAACQILRVVHLPTMLLAAPMGETDLVDLIRDDSDLWELLVEHCGISEEVRDESGEIWCEAAAKGITGWLVEAATPSPSQRARRRAETPYTWQVTRTQWFWGRSFEAAVGAAIEWAEKIGPVGWDREAAAAENPDCQVT